MFVPDLATWAANFACLIALEQRVDMFAGQVGQVVKRPAGQKGRSTKYHAPARVPAPWTRLQAQVALGVNLRTDGSSRIKS